jgi:hypothetical protein
VLPRTLEQVGAQHIGRDALLASDPKAIQGLERLGKPAGFTKQPDGV